MEKLPLQQCASAFLETLFCSVKFNQDHNHSLTRFLHLSVDFRTHILSEPYFKHVHRAAWSEHSEKKTWSYLSCSWWILCKLLFFLFSFMIIFYVSLFYVYYTTATGLGSALEVCREYLKSIAAGCLHLSRVGPVFSRGSHLGNERWRVAWLGPARRHWYSACVLLHRQPIVMARSVG